MPDSAHPSEIRQSRIGARAASITRAPRVPACSSNLRRSASTASRRFALAARRAAMFEAVGDSNRVLDYVLYVGARAYVHRWMWGGRPRIRRGWYAADLVEWQRLLIRDTRRVVLRACRRDVAEVPDAVGRTSTSSPDGWHLPAPGAMRWRLGVATHRPHRRSCRAASAAPSRGSAARSARRSPQAPARAAEQAPPSARDRGDCQDRSSEPASDVRRRLGASSVRAASTTPRDRQASYSSHSALSPAAHKDLEVRPAQRHSFALLIQVKASAADRTCPALRFGR
jgi:hypothetical protein